MKFCSSLLVAAALVSAVPVMAADAAPITANSLVKTADGARVGRIDRVIAGADGAPVAVKIIFKGRFITIPASSITSAEGGLVTSLSRSEVNKL